MHDNTYQRTVGDFMRDARRDAVNGVHIRIDPIGMDEETLLKIREIFGRHKGNCPVFFHVDVNARNNSKEEKIVKAHLSMGVKPSDDLVKEITDITGKNTVRYTLRGA